MSESKYIVTGLDDKKGKRMNFSHVQQEDEEEEEEKAKEFSKEGNESSSTATEPATVTELSEKMTVKQSGEDDVVLLFQKHEHSRMTQGQDKIHKHDEVITEPKSGDSYARDVKELQCMAAAMNNKHDTSIALLGPHGMFLFQLQLTRADVGYSRLLIPEEEAEDSFPPLPAPGRTYEEMLQICDTQHENWYMLLTYNREQHAFVITSGWQEFVNQHNLEATDLIRFYIPVPSLNDRHYRIECVKRKETRTISGFKQENFLFELQLTPTDARYGRLIIPKEEVRNHFPVVKIPAAIHKWETLKFTDAQNKEWDMKIVFCTGLDAYMIINGWEGFVKKHNLEAMDVIKFYNPVQPSQTRHFLIDYVKKEEAGTNLAQLGSAEKDGNGDDTNKGKEIAVGYEGNTKNGIFLFEMQLTPADVGYGRLFIPVEEAADSFPPLAAPGGTYKEVILQIYDTRHEDWFMVLTYNRKEYAFVITSGWQEFVNQYNLEAMDVIRFCRPVSRLHSSHYQIECVKRKLRQENFLFELQLTPTDFTNSGLIIPKEEVTKNFAGVGIPAVTHKLRTLKFTDAQNKDWDMTIIFDGDVDAYKIINGWEGFAKEHNLEAMDVIKFYKPVQPLHARHFLIDYVKREEAGTNLVQLGSTKNHGNGDYTSNKQGNRGRLSHSGSYKGKEIAVDYESSSTESSSSDD